MTDITADSSTAASAHSHEVRWVFDADGVSSPFAYTMGLAVRAGRTYELACSGLPAQLACSVLNNSAEQLVTDLLDPVDGLELDDVLIGYTVRLRPVENTEAFTGMRELLGEQPPVWQVLWPDRLGLFPGDEHYTDEPHQPLM